MVNRTSPNIVKRPMIWMCCALMAGIILGVYAAKRDMLIESVLLLLALYAIIIVLLLFKKVNSTAVVCLLCFTAFVVYSFFVYAERYAQNDFEDREYLISATVLDYDKIDGDSVRYEVDSVEIDSEKLGSHMLITVQNSQNVIDVGDNILFYSKIYTPSGARNSNLFDYKEYLADKRIYYTAYADYENITVTPYENLQNNSIMRIINRYKHNVADTYGSYLSDEAKGIIYAVTSGDSIYIDESVYNKYRITGTAHVLAISGLHVGFIVLFASLLTSRLRKYSVLYTIINLAVIWMYIIFAGMNISAIRAGIFFTMLCVGKTLKLRCDITNVAFVTAFIMLAVNPMRLFSVSFQLSFCAVIAIGILSPNMSGFISKRINFIPVNAINAFSTVMCAGIGVLLPIAYHYNTVSLVSAALNLIIVPLYSYIVLFGFALMLAAAINAPFLISAAATIINGFVRIVHIILDFAANIEYSHVTVASPSLTFTAAAVIILILLSVEKPSWIKNKLIPICSCLFILAANILLPYTGLDKTYTVSFIDVGQAECSLIVTPKNKTIMIDAGASYGTENTAEYTIIPYLLKHGNTCIDYLVLSHAHSDHIGEADELLEQIKVKNLVYYCPESDEQFAELKAIAEKNGVNLINMYYAQSIRADDGTYINRVCGYYSNNDVNEQSLVLEVKCANNSLLFAGDMTSAGLDSIDYSENVLVYKAAHHGSVTGLSKKIEEIKPLYTVIFTKTGNVYGLPDEEALEVYDSYSKTMLTQDCGEIKFVFNDNYVKVARFIKQ